MRRLLPPLRKLFFAEGFTVGALIHGGVLLVGAHQNAVQRAVVFRVAVIGALFDGAFDALVGMAIHGIFLLSLNYMAYSVQNPAVHTLHFAANCGML